MDLPILIFVAGLCVIAFLLTMGVRREFIKQERQRREREPRSRPPRRKP